MYSESEKIAIIVGTRPEIIKMAPVIREAERRDYTFSIIHTGQHYDKNLTDTFFERLDLPEPATNLGIGSGSQGDQTGAMISALESELLDREPDIVLVQGDTNSVLAGAIAASKLDVDLGHVEAGLRSYDREMPEEINRRVADHVSDYLFAPTNTAAETLLSEGVPESRVYRTGNTVVDAVYNHESQVEVADTIVGDLGLDEEPFTLLTLHRSENVDERDRFEQLLSGVASVAAERDLPVVYPIHPRANQQLSTFDLEVPDVIETIDPVGYFDFLALQRDAEMVFTDSGGVQEETCILGTPCITLRENTERPETVRVGANVVAGTDPNDIRAATEEMYGADGTWDVPFGNGDAAARILEALSGVNT